MKTDTTRSTPTPPTRVCCLCQRTISVGSAEVSHGYCQECFDAELKKLVFAFNGEPHIAHQAQVTADFYRKHAREDLGWPQLANDPRAATTTPAMANAMLAVEQHGCEPTPRSAGYQACPRCSYTCHASWSKCPQCKGRLGVKRGADWDNVRETVGAVVMGLGIGALVWLWWVWCAMK